MRIGRRSAWGLALVLAAPVRAGAPGPLSTDPAGEARVSGESRVVVRGIAGEIRLGAGAPGVLRYASAARDARETPLPVALTAVGSAFELGPVEGQQPAPRLLRLDVPEGMAVALATSDTAVTFRDVRSDVEVRGSRVTFSGSGIRGSLTLDLRGGAVEAGAVSGDVDVDGTDLALGLIGTGAASLDLTGGTAEIADVRGRLAANLSAVTFRAERVEGPATIRASGGSVFAEALGGESTLRLERAPAEIRANTGGVEVTTDAELRFANLKGPLRVDSLGGAVTGSGAASLLEVQSQGSTVDITAANGPLRIRGDGLTLRLKVVRGETEIRSGGSDVAIEDAAGALTLDDDSGTVSVVRASGALDITARKSAVRLEKLMGTLRLEADTEEASVGWSVLPKQGESVVRNDGGGIVATIPPFGACRIEARTSFGRVDSELPAVVADDTGKAAAGEVGKGSPSLIRLVANGDIRLLAAKPPPRMPRPAGTPPPHP